MRAQEKEHENKDDKKVVFISTIYKKKINKIKSVDLSGEISEKLCGNLN